MVRTVQLFSKWILIIAVVSQAAFYDGLGSFDDSEAGTTIFPILKRTPDARGLALGGNMGAMSNGPAAAWWNPAGLAEIRGYWTNFTHSSLYGELNQEFFTTTLPLSPGQTLAFTANGLWTGDIENARDVDEQELSYSSAEFMVGASYGWELVPRIFSSGISLYYLNSLIAEVNTQAISLDIGFKWNLKWDLVNSLSFHHIGPDVRSSRSADAPYERLPFTMRWSLGLPMGRDIVDLYAWNVGITKTNDGALEFHAGYERKWLDFLFLRGGRQISWSDQESGFWAGSSAGFGLRVNTLRFDYGYKYNGFLGAEHLLGIKFALFEKPIRERLPLMDQARAWYGEGDCNKAILLAEAVKERHPNSLEAAAIIQNCQVRHRLAKKEYVSIIYTNQIRGQLFDMERGDRLYGGFSRRAQLLKKLQKEHPLSLTVDAGHWEAPIRHWERDSLLIGGLKQMGYSAILWNPLVANEPSILNGTEMPTQFQNGVLPWIGEDTSSISQHHEIGGRHVLIFGVSDTLISATELNSKIQEDVKLWSQSHSQEELHLKVLLWPASASKVKRALAQGLQVDLILNGSGFSKSEQMNDTWVASGNAGEVGIFRFYYDDDQLVSYDHQMHPIHSGEAADPQMQTYLHEKIRAPEDVLNTWQVPKSPYFLFLNSLDEGEYDIYLKDPIKNYDYRVNHKAQLILSPDLSSHRQRIAFVEEVEGRKVLSIMNTVDKRSISISSPGVEVHQARWDPFDNWIFYHFSDEKGRHGLMRVRPSGLESKLFLREDMGYLKDFYFSQDARFVGTHWTEAGRSWIQHWSLRSKTSTQVSADSLYAYSPRYSPDGLFLAYLAEDLQEDPEFRGADLYLYDVNIGKTQRLTRGARIKSFTWSVEGKSIVYAEGDETQDMTQIHIATMMTKKVNQRVDLSSEENPQAYQYQGINGYLYERVIDDQRSIYWVSESGINRQPMVNLVGQNKLP